MTRQCECYSLVGSRARCLNRPLWIVQFSSSHWPQSYDLAYLCRRHLDVFNTHYHLWSYFPIGMGGKRIAA